MHHKMSIQRQNVSSHPFPPPSNSLSYGLFWKLADRYKCAQPIGDIFPAPSFSLCSRGWKADYGVYYEGPHTPCFSLNTVSGVCCVSIIKLTRKQKKAIKEKWLKTRKRHRKRLKERWRQKSDGKPGKVDYRRVEGASWEPCNLTINTWGCRPPAVRKRGCIYKPGYNALQYNRQWV